VPHPQGVVRRVVLQQLRSELVLLNEEVAQVDGALPQLETTCKITTAATAWHNMQLKMCNLTNSTPSHSLKPPACQ
jgi:hypothetical protein